MKNMIFEAINEFFSTGKLFKNINHTFITLVPKTENPNCLGDYRPIAYYNFLYKIIASILSKRIKIFSNFLYLRTKVLSFQIDTLLRIHCLLMSC